LARILVVDDEDGLRSFFVETLELGGHLVAQAADGEAALALLARQAFDLMLTDLRMPRLDGMELLRRVRAQFPEMEVIVLTAHGTVTTAVEALKLGAFDYLQKPVESPDEVLVLAERALERRRLLAWRERDQRDADDDGEALTYGAPAMAPVVDALRKVSPTEATVLLVGESGTGKEVVARAVHRWSRRAAGPFIAVNCAALSETLLESELFGHEKGAFTGAVARRRGRIELAAGGTFFLDEVGELKPELQAKLLRVLQSAGSPRRTATCAPSWRTDVSARTSTTGSPCSRSNCRRCATAPRTSSRSRGRSSSASVAASASRTRHSTRQPRSACGATPGLGTSASSQTRSSARSSSREATQFGASTSSSTRLRANARPPRARRSRTESASRSPRLSLRWAATAGSRPRASASACAPSTTS
jgi:DNA-binding response OmpR family regulator